MYIYHFPRFLLSFYSLHTLFIPSWVKHAHVLVASVCVCKCDIQFLFDVVYASKCLIAVGWSFNWCVCCCVDMLCYVGSFACFFSFAQSMKCEISQSTSTKKTNQKISGKFVNDQKISLKYYGWFVSIIWSKFLSEECDDALKWATFCLLSMGKFVVDQFTCFFFACTTESIFSWFNHIIISKFAHFACVDKTNKKRLYTHCHRIGAMYLYNNNQKKNINLCKHSLCYVENVQKPAYHVIVVTGNTCVRPVHSYTYRPTTTFI